MKSLLFKASLAWLCLCFLAFVNGALREMIIKKLFYIAEPKANQLSCITGVLLWTIFTIWYWSRLKIKSFVQALSVGLGWFITTLFFETFVLDRKLDWSQVVNTYDISAGRYWGLVLIWIGLMPIAFFSILRLRKHIIM